MRKAQIALLVAMSLIIGACAADEVATDATNTAVSELDGEATDEDLEEDEDEHALTFGEPADAADADRVIEIDANDDFSFSPNAVDIATGETVTFRVVNTGQVPHDFTLGNSEVQDDHEAEMASGGMHEGESPNAMLIQPGETGEMTWTFTEATEIIMGCHVVGHYGAGMRGTLTIGA